MLPAIRSFAAAAAVILSCSAPVAQAGPVVVAEQLAVSSWADVIRWRPALSGFRGVEDAQTFTVDSAVGAVELAGIAVPIYTSSTVPSAQLLVQMWTLDASGAPATGSGVLLAEQKVALTDLPAPGADFTNPANWVFVSFADAHLQLRALERYALVIRPDRTVDAVNFEAAWVRSNGPTSGSYELSERYLQVLDGDGNITTPWQLSTLAGTADFAFQVFATPVSIPEPATGAFVVLGLGLLGLAGRRRKS